LVQPHFNYCSIAWGNCGKKLSEKLEKLQNRAARILTSSSYDADAGYLLQQLRWKDLIAQHRTQVVLMAFKALNNLVPDQLSSMFTDRSTLGYVLRDSTDKLNVLLPRTNYLKRNFSYRGATLSGTAEPVQVSGLADERGRLEARVCMGGLGASSPRIF